MAVWANINTNKFIFEQIAIWTYDKLKKCQFETNVKLIEIQF